MLLSNSQIAFLLVAEEVGPLYVQIAKYCAYAASVISIYDWLLCLHREVAFIWNWRSGITSASLVYAFSRYAMLIQSLVVIATNVPMSDLSCTTVAWIQSVAGILGTIAFGVFSGLRAYALSNRKIWLAIIIALLTLPPMVLSIGQGATSDIENLPHPFNCFSKAISINSLLTILFLRASQFMAEFLLVIITLRHAYQSSYQLRKCGIKAGTSLSSILAYNGSIYLLFIGSLYVVDIIFNIANSSPGSPEVGSVIVIFYDPITSTIVCRFMLSLRQFDSATASSADSRVSSFRAQRRTASTAYQSVALPGENFPAFIASFAQPVHINESKFWEDPDAIAEDGSERQETDFVERTTAGVFQRPSGVLTESSG